MHVPYLQHFICQLETSILAASAMPPMICTTKSAPRTLKADCIKVPKPAATADVHTSGLESLKLGLAAAVSDAKNLACKSVMHLMSACTMRFERFITCFGQQQGQTCVESRSADLRLGILGARLCSSFG